MVGPAKQRHVFYADTLCGLGDFYGLKPSCSNSYKVCCLRILASLVYIGPAEIFDRFEGVLPRAWAMRNLFSRRPVPDLGAHLPTSELPNLRCCMPPGKYESAFTTT